MRSGCESSRKFLETQVISSSLDGWTMMPSPVGWMEFCFNHLVICCSLSLPYYSHVLPLPMLFVYRNEPCAAAAKISDIINIFENITILSNPACFNSHLNGSDVTVSADVYTGWVKKQNGNGKVYKS